MIEERVGLAEFVLSKNVLILIVWLFAGPAWGQASQPATDAAAAAQIDQAGDDLREVMIASHRVMLSDAQLKAQLAALPPVRAALNTALQTLVPHLQDADARLAQLGSAPTTAQPAEPAETAAARAALTRARAVIDAEAKQARVMIVESDQIADSVSVRLRDNFESRLWARSRSVLDPGLWREFAGDVPSDLRRVAAAMRDEGATFFAAVKAGRGAFGLMVAALLAFGIAGPGRVVLNRWGFRWARSSVAAEPLLRSGLALWLLGVAILTALAAGLTVRGALMGENALTPVFVRLAGLIVRGVVFAAGLEGLGRAVLSPGRPQWRMAPMADEVVRRLSPYPALIGVTAGLASIVAGLNAALGVSLSSSVTADCCAMLIELAVVGGALASTARAREALLAEPGAAARRTSGARLPWVLTALAAWLALIGALIAVLTGYLALATFLMRETIWIGAVLATMFLLLRFTDEAFPAWLAPSGKTGRLIGTALGLSRAAMEQIGVLLAGLARLLLLLLGWMAVLAPFGAGIDEVAAKLAAGGVTLRFGHFALSPGTLLGAVVLFLVGLAATRAVRRWLETRYLPKTRLDVGLRTSATSAVTYLGGAVALLVAFAYLGVSLGQMALLAGALSVGIGFGLQAIIGNFVSGLILLAERPFAVGDWVAVGELEGDVRRINIRATEIVMADRSKLIVPNADLVSKTVRNMTHAGGAGRVRIVLRIDGRADPFETRDLLLAGIAAHKAVVADPAPMVLLTDVACEALEFTVLAFVADPRKAAAVKSDLLFDIVAALRSRGIALAQGGTTVRVDLADRVGEPALPREGDISK